VLFSAPRSCGDRRESVIGQGADRMSKRIADPSLAQGTGRALA
jgi:hypothetical protein